MATILIAGEMDDDLRDEIIDLSFDDIDNCFDVDQLAEWYGDCRELVDDVISQIETNKEVTIRADHWERRAYAVIVATKKKMRRILRHCDQHNINRPDGDHQRIRNLVTSLNNKLRDARAAERELVVRYLTSGVSGTPADLAAAIRERKHLPLRAEAEVAQ